MALKFPTAQRIFPTVTLAEPERVHFQQLATTLVAETLLQYDAYNYDDQRKISRAQWKPVKKRENLTVYKEKRGYRRYNETDAPPQSGARAWSTTDSISSSSEDEAAGHVSTAPTSPGSTQWSVPTLLMVGTIVGTLDDVMYGVATFDAPSMLLKTTYTQDELVDGEILNQIHGPTGDAPYRFLGLKWIVKGNPVAISAIVRPRDLVFLESTGITRSSTNGERVGYHLMHSVDLPGYGPMRGKSVLRGRVSSCIVFKQLSNGTVDVYMRANFEPNGRVSEPVAVLSAANGLIYCWRSVFCAQYKKLAWLLQNRRRHASTAIVDLQQSQSSCSNCGKAQGKFRQLTTCQLCLQPMCSKCRVSSKISFAGASGTEKEIRQQVIPLCTRCVSSANQMDAFAIAREQVLSGRWETANRANGGAETSQRKGSVVVPVVAIETTNAEASGVSDASVNEVESFPVSASSIADLDDAEDPGESTGSPSAVKRSRLSFQSLSNVVGSPGFEPGFNEYDLASEREVSDAIVLHEPAAGIVRQYPQEPMSTQRMDQHQAQLWHQMTQLQAAAESIYQYTTHLGASSR